jgi:hypothetical protein
MHFLFECSEETLLTELRREQRKCKTRIVSELLAISRRYGEQNNNASQK